VLLVTESAPRTECRCGSVTLSMSNMVLSILNIVLSCHWPSRQAHTHISKGRVDALELPNKLSILVINDKPWGGGGAPPEIVLGWSRVRLIHIEVVLEHDLWCDKVGLLNPKPNVLLEE